MAWIRLDCATQDDDFMIVGLTGDEFKAWTLFLLRVKSTGARGSVPATSLSSLARNWNLPEVALSSMLSKAWEYPGRDGQPGRRIWEEGGRWYIRNWKKYQEEHKQANPEEFRGPSSGKSGKPEHPPEGTTPPPTTTLPHTTPQEEKDTVSRLPAVDLNSLREQDFVLRLHPAEFTLFLASIQRLIRAENAGRNGNVFVWDQKHGGFESDIKKLIYSGFTDESKKKILIQAYNVLAGKLNWPEYVRLGIQYTIRSSQKTRIDTAHGFTLNILRQPGKIEREVSDGILS